MAAQNQTTPTLEPRPEFAGIIREQETFGRPESQQTNDRINRWFDRLMIQGGIETPPAIMVLLCLLCGLAVGGAVFVVFENILGSAVALSAGFFLPIVVALISRMRRQVLMLRQLPAMIDELARAAKTGRSLEHCLQVISEDTPPPLGYELKLCVRKLKMGVGLGEALKDLPERTGLVNLNIFVMALKVHQQTGGDLVQVLERLSQTIRDRILFIGRLRAATAASRATAILMIALPPAILIFFTFRDPDYFAQLMSSSWGQFTTLIAVALQIIGSVWILRILKNSQRM